MTRKIVGTIDRRLLQSSEHLLNVSYKIPKLAEKLGLSPRYIRRMLIGKYNAPHTRDGNGHILVNGQDLRKWIENFFEEEASAKRMKTPLGDNEFYCVKCRARVLLNDFHFANDGCNNFLKGRCPVCGTKVNKYLKGNNGK